MLEDICADDAVELLVAPGQVDPVDVQLLDLVENPACLLGGRPEEFDARDETDRVSVLGFASEDTFAAAHVE